MGFDGAAFVDRFPPGAKTTETSGCLASAVVAGFAPVFQP
jgi:hypothetical protein